MRQTIIKEGVQDQISHLIGDGVSSYSVQASMLEDMDRICGALLGDSTTGKVMAGMMIGYQGGAFYVDPGYGVTSGRKIFKVAERSLSAAISSPVVGDVWHIYAQYSTKELGDSDGGKQLYSSYQNGKIKVIKDQIGAAVGSIASGENIILASKGTISMPADGIYIGDWQFTSASGAGFATYPSNSAAVDYTYSRYVMPRSTTSYMLWTGVSTLNTDLATDSFSVLDPGTNRLKSLRVFRKHPSTSAIRTGASASSYYINLDIYGVDAGGIETKISPTSLVLPDTINQNSYVDFDVNFIMTNVKSIYLKSTVTTADFSVSSGDASLVYVIDKLT